MHVLVVVAVLASIAAPSLVLWAYKPALVEPGVGWRGLLNAAIHLPPYE